MRIIKLDAIDSTNTFLKEISSADVVEDFTVVTAKQQTQGKGRMGNKWQAKPAQNLTFSVFKLVNGIRFSEQFYFSIVTALAMAKTLKSYNLPKISVKWPNDILSADKKIGGILIENVIQQNKLSHTIIGVGLNVNQTEFNNLPRASSLRLISGNVFDLDELLYRYMTYLKHYFKILESGKVSLLNKEYESQLFRNNKPSTFKNTEGLLFSGIIKGITNSGNLKVMLEDNILKTFALNEIKLLY